MNTITAAAEFIKAKEMLEAAEAAKAQAEAILKEAFAKAGVEFEIVDGVKVAIVNGTRATYDADALADLVSAPTFRTVTKPAVDGKKFKAAVEIGKITPEVAAAVTKETPYASVRVTALTSEAKADRRAAVAA